MNQNHIRTDGFSNPESEQLYRSQWRNEPDLHVKYENGEQCGGCSFYAKFNADWGLCCHPKSRHHLESVFEHFTCSVYADESWRAHSFLTVEDRIAFQRLEAESLERWNELKKRASDLGLLNDSEYKEG